MVSYHPLKIQVKIKFIGQSVLELESRNQNILDEHTSQTGKLRDANFEGIQALLVSYHPVKFQIDRTKCLQVRFRKQNFKMVAIMFFLMAPTLKAT